MSKGRGTILNLKNRFEFSSFEREATAEETPVPLRSTYFKDEAKTILNYQKSPDMDFGVSINPYRGCEHGCIYCYARPTHEYIGLSLGQDFETKIYVKHKAPQLLRNELKASKWENQPIFFSGVTDCYQPAEKEFKITRQCLEVCYDYRVPVFIITKNHLILRDLDILEEMAKENLAAVMFSVTSLDNELWRVMEPRSSSPRLRIRAIEEMSKRKIPVGINIAPIIPGLNEHEIIKIMETARGAGAIAAGYTFVRLPYQVKDLFVEWLKEHFPLRANKVIHFIQGMRQGKLNDPDFHSRFHPQGPFAKQIEAVFKVTHQKLGFRDFPELNTKLFRPEQMSFF